MKKIYLMLCIMALLCAQQVDAQKRSRKYKKKVINKALITTAPRTDSLNQSMLLCYTTYDMPAWYLAVKNNFLFPAQMQAPSDYRLATINDTLLANYLKTIPYDVYTKKIMLPLYKDYHIECKEFLIQRVVTMDSALQAKYPELMSFKGMDDMNKLNTARIDCDGNTTQIMINIDGKIYFVTPVMMDKKIYYVCYAKDDANFVKDNFER